MASSIKGDNRQTIKKELLPNFEHVSITYSFFKEYPGIDMAKTRAKVRPRIDMGKAEAKEKDKRACFWPLAFS